MDLEGTLERPRAAEATQFALDLCEANAGFVYRFATDSHNSGNLSAHFGWYYRVYSAYGEGDDLTSR